jgi:ankyrin repeat protein
LREINPNQLDSVNKPLFNSLLNNFYRILIEAGADVNSSVGNATFRDKVEQSISYTERIIEGYKRELSRLNKEEKFKTSEEQNLQYLSKLLEEEKRVARGTYRENVLNGCSVESYNNYLHDSYPQLYPRKYSQNVIVSNINITTYAGDVKKLTELLELETKKLNHCKECLKYLINHGAKTFYEINLEKNLETPKRLLKQYQDRLSSIEKLLEHQDEMEVEEKERYLKEVPFLQLNIVIQQEEIDRLMNNKQKPYYNNDDSNVELPLEILSSDSIVEINFDKYLINFMYLSPNRPERKVPEELFPEYVKLFQAVYVNDIRMVEMMSQSLVLAVRDNLNMTPFSWACLLGHSELSVKILDISVGQYTGIYKKNY